MGEKNLSFKRLVSVLICTFSIGFLSLLVQVDRVLAETNEIELSIQQEKIREGELSNVTVTDSGMFQEAVYLVIPEGLTLDMAKTEQKNDSSHAITFDKNSQVVKLEATETSDSVTSVNLILTGEAGNYELVTSKAEDGKELSSNKVSLNVKKNKILFSSFNSIVDKELVNNQGETRATAGDRLTLSFSKPSKTTLNGTTDRVGLIVSPGTTDTANPLYKGKLTIKIGKGLRLSSYSNNIYNASTNPNSKIKNYEYDYIDNKLTYEFIDGLSTTDLPNIVFNVMTGFLAGKAGVDYQIDATFTGETQAGLVYETKTSKGPEFTVSGVTYNQATKDNLNFSGTLSTSIMPGQSGVLSVLTNLSAGRAINFENFIIKTKDLNSKPYFGFDRRQPFTEAGPADVYTGKDRKVNTWQEGNTRISETGQYTLNNNAYGYYVVFNMPGNAVPGSQYKYEISYYDGDTLLKTIPMTVTVSQVSTTASLKTEIQSQIAPGEGFIDQTLYPSMTTAGKGIKDNNSIFKIPENLTVDSFSFANNGMSSGNRHSIYYQYDTDAENTWTRLTDGVGSSGLTFKNIKNRERIRKIKVNYYNIIGEYVIYSPLVLRYSYKNAKTKDKYTIINEENSYFDNNKNITVSLPKKDVTATVTDFGSQAGALKKTHYLTGVFNNSYKNGDSFITSYDIQAETYVPFKEPYKFIIAPPGIDVTVSAEGFVLPFQNRSDYHMGNSTYRVYPQIRATYNSKKKLSDGSTIYFYKDKYPLTKIDSTYNTHWKTEYKYSVNTSYSGKYELLIGSGSAVSDNYTNADLVSLSDKTEGVSEEIRDYLVSQGVTSSKFVPDRNTIKVVEEDNLEIYSKVKLTTEDTYINVTNPNSLMEMVPGQAADYQVEIKNTGTTEIKNVSVMDILPYKDDTEILSNVPRNSDFRLFLTGEVKDIVKNGKTISPSEYDMFYSKSKKPERWNKNGQVIAGDSWGSLPDKITDVQAFKLDLKESFVPGDSMVLNFKLQVPADAPRSSDTKKYLAYNTIAYHSDKKTSESNRVRVQTKAPGDLRISGRVFNDLSINGVVDNGEPGFDSQTVMLYKKVGSTYQKVDERQTTVNEGVSGFYTYNNELENGETYKIAVDFTELIKEGYTPSQITSEYSSVVMDETDKTIGWLVKNGRSEFIVSDKAITGHAPVYELDAPVYKATQLSVKIPYEYFDGTPSDRKTFPSKGMKVTLQKADGTPVKDEKGNNVSATVAENGVADFGKLPLASNMEYELIFPNSRAYKLTYKNNAKLTYDDVVQAGAIFTKTVTEKGETATFSFSDITPGSSIQAVVFTTSYNVLQFGEVSDTLTFGENGKLALSVFNKRISPNPFKLEVEDSRVVKEPKWKVTATITTDLQAEENGKVVSKLPGAVEYVQTNRGITTGTALSPGTPVVIEEVTDIKEDAPDNVLNIPEKWTNKSGIVLNIPSGVPELKTYSTDILWTLTNAPY